MTVLGGKLLQPYRFAELGMGRVLKRKPDLDPLKDPKNGNPPNMNPLLHRGTYLIIEGFHFWDPLGGLGSVVIGCQRLNYNPSMLLSGALHSCLRFTLTLPQVVWKPKNDL